jgi:hypothetical protein
VKWFFVAIATVLLLLACGRGGEVVFLHPTPEPTSTPEPTLTPTSAPTLAPDPYKELEDTYFPVLAELRKIPGNEAARVDWEMRGPLSGRIFTTPSGRSKFIFYVVYGIKRIPLNFLIPNVPDPRFKEEAGVYIQRGWMVLPNGGAIGFFLPDGRTGFDCSQGGVSASTCSLGDGEIVVESPEKGIWLEFNIYVKGEWGLNVPEWEGPLPPTREGK